MNRRTLYLKHAIDCVDKILDYTQVGKALFLEDSKTQDAVIRNLEVIGQCIKDYGLDVLETKDPSVPWQKIAGTRNVLAHEYLGVDISLVWEIVDQYLVDLSRALRTIVETS
jgi:uncharacterized protein with HEPN domain